MTSTQERIAALMTANIDGDSGASLVGHLAVAEIIAAEIDALTAQRDEATAKAKALTLEVERLRPAAEAVDAMVALRVTQDAYSAASDALANAHAEGRYGINAPAECPARDLARTNWHKAQARYSELMALVDARAREAAKGAA